ncbi:MAG: hypothetical protein ACOY5B_18510 [Spirochaetota bacterium]
MNETEFQALFDSYQQACRTGSDNPIPQKLHLLVYNYAQLRHQQSSDVSADFYLHVAGKLEGILQRYDARRLPFYQYMASTLNFEFSHFLRRRKLPRTQIELLSVEELAERRLELQYRENPTPDPLSPLLAKMRPPASAYARLALACPLTYGELRYLLQRGRQKDGSHWKMLRAYRGFLRFAEEKRENFLRERDRLLQVLMRTEQDERASAPAARRTINKRRDSARRKFFSMDTRIPIRIVAEVTGDSIATAQRQLKAALETLKSVYARWEKQNLLETQRNR